MVPMRSVWIYTFDFLLSKNTIAMTEATRLFEYNSITYTFAN